MTEKEGSIGLEAKPAVKPAVKWTFKKETLFTLLMLAVSAYAFQQSTTFPFGSGLYPMVIALICIGLVIGQVILELRQKVLMKEAMDIAVEESQKGKLAMKRAVRFLYWFLGLYAGIWILGYKVMILPWIMGYMRFEGHIKLWKIFLFAAIAGLIILWVLPKVLSMDMPEGMLQDYLRRNT